MAVLAGKVAGIYTAAVGTPTAFTNEATTGNAAKTIYTITNAAKRAWPLDSAVTVKKDGVTVTTGFTIHYAGGQVVFDSALTTEVVTVSGTFCTITEQAGMYDWKTSVSVKEQDVTDFTAATANGCEVHAPVGLVHNTLSCSSFWQSTALAQLAGELLYVKAFISSVTGERYEAWCRVVSVDIDAALDKVIEAPLTLQPTGGMWYSAT